MKPTDATQRWILMLLPLALSACGLLLPPKPAAPPTPPHWMPIEPLPEPGDSHPLWPQN